MNSESKFEMKGSRWIVIGCLLAAIAVGFGAIGAHLLEKSLTEKQLEQWETAAKYQMYHAIGLMLVGMTTSLSRSRKKLVGCVMLTGVILFSGSLYAYVLSDIKPLVALVPFGGFSMIISWLMFAWFGYSSIRGDNRELGE
jgi:uncharacterized membrane protein YgdD (TMEM256/DUF423 family)